MEFGRLPELTRSYRRFREDQRIPSQTLFSFVNAARLAPCAGNLQRLRFSIIEERGACEAVFPLLKWAGYLKNWDGPVPGERPAAYILIQSPGEEKPFTGMDVGIAAAYIVLAARDAGYGSCMMLSFDREGVSKTVNIPECKLVIALGIPGEDVVLERAKEDRIEYWRDSEGRHHVPKIDLDTIIMEHSP